MVSIRYLFDVAEFSCVKSMPGRVGDVGELHVWRGRAPQQHRQTARTDDPAAAQCAIAPIALLDPNFRGSTMPLVFVDHEEVIGGQVAEGLLHAGRPGDLDDVGRGRPRQAEVQPEVVLRVVARPAHHLVDLRRARRGDLARACRSPSDSSACRRT